MPNPSDDFDGFFPIEEIARICQVSLKTAKRWKSGASRAPAAALMLLKGDLGALDPAWRGWRIRRGLLLTPDGLQITVADVLALPFMRMQIATYQAENRKLQIPDIEEQPLPDAWDSQTQVQG